MNIYRSSQTRLHATLAAAALLAGLSLPVFADEAPPKGAPAAAQRPQAEARPAAPARAEARADARAAAAAREAVAECRGSGLASSRRAFLGVEATPITPELRRHFGSPEGAGVLVSRLIEGGPAARAGIAVGDVLTRCAGTAVAEPRDLRGAVRDKKGGEAVTVEVFRDGKPRQVSVTLDDRDSCAFDIGQVLDPRDLEELGRLGALAESDALRQLGDLDIDLSALDIQGLVEGAIGIAAAGMEHALKSGELERELEKLHDGRAEEIERRMQEVSRQLEKLEQKLEAEGRAHGDKTRAEMDRAREEMRRELERAKEESRQQIEEGRREAEETRREAERAAREAAKAGGGAGGGEIL